MASADLWLVSWCCVTLYICCSSWKFFSFSFSSSAALAFKSSTRLEFSWDTQDTVFNS